MRTTTLNVLAALTTMATLYWVGMVFAILATHPAHAASPRAFVLNSQGGVIACRLAATDLEVAYCAGETDNEAANPARFNCAEAEVDSEFQFCRLPYPRRAR